MSLPSGIIFVNNNIVEQIRDTLIKQLFITSVMDGYVYDAIIQNDPLYPTFVHNNNQRIMVIRSFRELESRETADVVIHVKQGMAAVEKNNFGPPGLTSRVAELYWGEVVDILKDHKNEDHRLSAS